MPAIKLASHLRADHSQIRLLIQQVSPLLSHMHDGKATNQTGYRGCEAKVDHMITMAEALCLEILVDQFLQIFRLVSQKSCIAHVSSLCMQAGP